MVCHHCQPQVTCKKFGRTSDGRQRYRCRACRRVLTEPKPRPKVEIRVPRERALLVLSLLCEGASVRAVERLTGTEKHTILRLLTVAGAGCERLLSELVKDVEVRDVQADELFSYVAMKEGTKKRKGINDPEFGDAYCYIGLERHSKLVLAWHLGRRNRWDADSFMEKLSRATAGHFQLSTDGFPAYPEAVEYNLGGRVNYAQLVKDFKGVGGEEQRQYAPPRLIGAEKISVSGEPEEHRICTSHVERANWTLRGHLRRFTRLSNGFSRKRENLRAALALYFAFYNLVRIHKTIRMTPAMKADLTRKPWSMGDLFDAALAA